MMWIERICADLNRVCSINGVCVATDFFLAYSENLPVVLQQNMFLTETSVFSGKDSLYIPRCFRIMHEEILPETVPLYSP